MARFHACISSTLSQEDAFAYVSAFENATQWDPGVRESQRVGVGALRVGTQFRVLLRFADEDMALVYEITRLEPPRLVVLEAGDASVRARESFSVEPDGHGSVVDYDDEHRTIASAHLRVAGRKGLGLDVDLVPIAPSVAFDMAHTCEVPEHWLYWRTLVEARVSGWDGPCRGWFETSRYGVRPG